MNAAAMRTVAEWIVEFMVARGVDRVYGLQGGHIQPIWDHLAQRKVRIVDVRDEGAGVHMAHCHAVLTGQVGVAFATAGPGVTNCVTRDRQCAARARAGAVDRRVRARAAGRPRPVAGHRSRVDHEAGDAQRAHAAHRRQPAARPRQGMVGRDGRRQPAGARVHRDSDRRAARTRAAATRARRIPRAEAAAPHSTGS